MLCSRDTKEVGQMTNREADQDRKNRAYELRLQGHTYRSIGKLLGIGHGTAERWCKEHMESVSLPLIDEVRKTEVDRLLRYLRVLDDRIEEGDDKAVGLAIKVSESLRKLLGVDVPVTQTVEHVEVTALDMDIRRLIDQQNDLNARELQRAADKELGGPNE